MGWLLRTINSPHFGITFSETMIPENPDHNTYEVVEATSHVKPPEQLAAEAGSLKLAVKALAKALLTANTPEAVLFRNVIKQQVIDTNVLRKTIKDTCTNSTNTNLRTNLIAALPGNTSEADFLSNVGTLIDNEV